MPMRSSILTKLIALCLGILAAQTLAAQELHWYRGNTHSQTTRSDGTSTPEELAKAYYDLGYDFLCLTDVMARTGPEDLASLGAPERPFLIVPGQELKTVYAHATAMNTDALIETAPVEARKSLVLAEWMKAVRAAGGILIANHPNAEGAYGFSTEDLRAVEGLRLIEIFNAKGWFAGLGDRGTPPVEKKWDDLLSSGLRIYGVASDDSHYLSSDVGKGWVMVQAPELSSDALCAALLEGDFYASNGVFLKSLEVRPELLRVEIDLPATEREIARGLARGLPAAANEPLGERIEFIGARGKPLRTVKGLVAEYSPRPGGYTRARAVVTRVIKNRKVDFTAWIQPVFLE